ncbi:VOC family protein [Algoriphagus formosus]|uniref:VOC family protein n=1 Tax=Algoriphagus formosus TaxID=2007308 RepID=UPI000C286BE3|nr:VOC family protein [Algoriphagus formosus]
MEILTLVLQSANLEKTRRFYQEKLGFEILLQDENKLVFQVGFSKLIFEKVEVESSPQYHYAFLIPYNSIEQAYQWLLDRVQILNSESGPIVDFKSWKAKSVYFEDSLGNILEFIERSDLQNEINDDFSSQSILCINEIGIVGNSPLEIAEKIRNDSGLDYFSKGPKESDFMVLGEDSGLLIISKKGRNWYPTLKPSKPFPVRFEIKKGDKETWFEWHK